MNSAWQDMLRESAHVSCARGGSVPAVLSASRATVGESSPSCSPSPTLHVDMGVVSHVRSFLQSKASSPNTLGEAHPWLSGKGPSCHCRLPESRWSQAFPDVAWPYPRGPSTLPGIPVWSCECWAHSWHSEGKGTPLPPPLTHLASGGGMRKTNEKPHSPACLQSV